jgi:hypothetical protein
MASQERSGPDGKSCVDAVVAAGQRSRALISIVIVLMVLTFTSLRNNYEPAWNYIRVQLYEDLYDCLKQGDFNHIRCSSLKERIERIEGRGARVDDVTKFAATAEIELKGKFGDENFQSLNGTKIKELQTRFNALIAKDAEGETITIPVLGSQIDYNDLWLVSGVVMFCLLYMLYASLEQEYRNVKYVAENRPEFLDLVFMYQVSPALRLDVRPITTIAQNLLWLTPTGLYLYLFISDVATYPLSVAFAGSSRAIVEYFFEAVTVVAVIYADFRCMLSQSNLRKLLIEYRKEVRLRIAG